MPFAARGVLADLDGTLLDTEPLYYDAYASVCTSLGASYTPAFHVAHLLGRPQDVGVAACIRLLGLSVTPDEFLARRDATLLTAFARAPAMRGADAFVRAARAALGTGRLCIATSSKRALVDAKGEGAAGRALFDVFGGAVVCSDDALMAGRPGKPAPDIFLAAAGVIGIPAHECVALEDSIAGIQAAAAAGCFVVAIPDARLAPEDVRAAGAHVVLASLEDVDLAAIGLGGCAGVA
jgi:beta-phosphoglucomutase-like phosphatase (HAD superfamily)